MHRITPNELPNDAALWQRLTHPDDSDRVNEFFQNVLKDSTESYEVEFRLLHKNGQYVPCFIGTLAGGIAHDFNNMLSVITGNISYALNNANKNDELYEVLLDVQESSKQAQNLTHQLLTFSKGELQLKKSQT